MLMPTPEGSLRYQRVLRAAVERLDRLRFSGELDAYFWSSVREALTAAGATEADIRANAAEMIGWIGRNTRPGSEDWQEQTELIAEHLACCTDLEIRIGKAGQVSVIFPGREAH